MSKEKTTAPTLPGFHFIEWLGGGGFADVFRYEEVALGRQVAVKVLHRGRGAVELASFATEANLMARLSNHPSIVSIFQASVAADGRPYLVMEMCPAQHLGIRIGKRTFDTRKALEITIQIAGAVETAHRLGILHRDIKPANILFTEFGRPALTDFGISVSTAEASTTAGRALSPLWAPPEQFGSSPDPMSPASDVYSLAATLWAMLVGRSPMELPAGPNDTLSVGSRVRTQPVPRTNRADVPESLELVLRTAMAKKPAERYGSALEFARALQSIQSELRQAQTTIDILEEYHDDFVPDETETGTRVGFMLIEPDQPATPTVTNSVGPVEGRTEMLGSTTGPKPTAGVLQHGYGVREGIAPLDLTGPQVPLPDTGVRRSTIPDDSASGPARRPIRRRSWLVISAFVAALAAGLGGWALLGTLGRGTTAPAASETVRPKDPISAEVAPVEKVTMKRQGKHLLVSWVNPQPESGDQYGVHVRDPRQSTVPTYTDRSRLLIEALPGSQQTCVEVTVLRVNGRSSEPSEPTCL